MLKQPQVSDDAPWKRRFRIPIYIGPQVARSAPERGLVLGNEAGSFQWYAWDIPTGARRQLTQRPEGMRSGYLTPDGRWVYYLEDEKGNEIGHYVRIPFEGGAPQDLTPTLPPYASWSISESGNGTVIGMTIADDDGHHVLVMERGVGRSVGAPRALYHARKETSGPVLSQDGAIAVVLSSERSEKGHFSLIAFDARHGGQISELWDGPDTNVEAEAHAFSPLPGDTRLLATSNRTGFARPLVWDPCTGERTDLRVESLSGEIYPAAWSDDTRTVLLKQVSEARARLHLYDLETGAITPIPHPGGTWGSLAFLPDGRILAQWQDATHPSQVVALDPRTGEITPLLAAEDVPPASPWTSVTFTGANGDPVQGWLIMPEGQGPFPTILDTHGGPYAVTAEGFSPRHQMWVDHGFAVLSINYHGSTTFGKEFQESIIGRVGEYEVEDLVAAREWLVENGIADPERILLTGWSYGGYLTLHALGLAPDLWAGGMAGVPVADWPACHVDSAETLKSGDAALFGGRLEDVPEKYEKASPLAYAQNVTKPVLIIQGRNDTRCPARQVTMYEERMHALGKPIEVVWFDAGHGSLVVEQTIAHWETMLKFAYKELG